MLEIGGGLGVLSEHLAARTAHVHVVEIDERLREPLLDATAGHANVSVHWEDVMRMDLAGLSPTPTKVVANLPYGVAAGALLRTIEELPGVELWVAMVAEGGRRAARRRARQRRLRRAVGDRAARVRGAGGAGDPARRVPSRPERRLGARRHAPHGAGAERGRARARGRRVRAPPQDARGLAGAVRARARRLARAHAGGAGAARPPRGRARRAARARDFSALADKLGIA